jgi:hypothetical protein
MVHMHSLDIIDRYIYVEGGAVGPSRPHSMPPFTVRAPASPLPPRVVPLLTSAPPRAGSAMHGLALFAI